jgi:hypothetical protein
MEHIISKRRLTRLIILTSSCPLGVEQCWLFEEEEVSFDSFVTGIEYDIKITLIPKMIDSIFQYVNQTKCLTYHYSCYIAKII